MKVFAKKEVLVYDFPVLRGGFFRIKSAIKNGKSYLFVGGKVKTRESPADQPRNRSRMLHSTRVGGEIRLMQRDPGFL